MKKRNIDLSLVLPLYNEGPTLPLSLRAIDDLLSQTKLEYEAILIDDKSQDRTVSLAKKQIRGKNNWRLLCHSKNLGRGAAVAEGIKKARGRVVGFIDVDLEVGPDYILGMVSRILSKQTDVVTGERVYKLKPSSLLRHTLSLIYRWLARMLLGLPFKDTETGYKFFDREKILPVVRKVKNKGWFWDTEIMAQAHYHRLKVLEIPVLFVRRFDKKSSVKVFKDSWDYLIKLLKFKIRIKA